VAQRRRVLVCDDEPQILRALRVVLHDGGYEVDTAAGLGEALERAARRPPDAAIVDLVLPDGDGVELCAELRSWSTMPILVLSALDDEEQKVRALGAGADDYLTKPFSARELIARLEAIFRRVGAREEEAVVVVKGLEINFAAHTVARNGREVRLTPTEFRLLGVLARNRGRLMTSRALLAEVWGPAHARDTALLRTHIANLRHKIEAPDQSSWQYIRTEAGVGYRFAD
jgi:two-component system, OmpR family, KDP operon response regulator KdpE